MLCGALLGGTAWRAVCRITVTQSVSNALRLSMHCNLVAMYFDVSVTPSLMCLVNIAVPGLDMPVSISGD